MVSQLILLITDEDNDIATVKYTFPSVIPAQLYAKIDLTEFLFPEGAGCRSAEYLRSAKAIYDIIARQGKKHLLSDSSLKRLELLNKVYNGICYEKLRLCRQKISRLDKCNRMLSASQKITGFIKKSSFEDLTSEDFYIMKRYLMSFIPDTSELMDYPEFCMLKIRPVFDLLKLLIDIAPAENEKNYISKIYRLFYGG